MKKATKLRLFGGVILLVNLWLIGRYDIVGVTLFLLTFGFAIGYEYLVVRPLSKAGKETQRKAAYPITEEQPQDDEFVPLVIAAVLENNLHTIPDNDLLAIYQKARVAGSHDPAFPKVITTLKDELAKRGVDEEKKCPSCTMMVPEEAVICPCCKKKIVSQSRKTPWLRSALKSLSIMLGSYITRRTALITFALLVLLALAFMIRYDEEYIQGPLYRYDRFTSTVEVRRAEGDVFRWVPLPRLKNLQQVRDMRTRIVVQGGVIQGGNNIEELKRQMERGNEELKRQIEEGNKKLEHDNEELKRKVEDAESRRSWDETVRKSNETTRQIQDANRRGEPYHPR